MTPPPGVQVLNDYFLLTDQPYRLQGIQDLIFHLNSPERAVRDLAWSAWTSASEDDRELASFANILCEMGRPTRAVGSRLIPLFNELKFHWFDRAPIVSLTSKGQLDLDVNECRGGVAQVMWGDYAACEVLWGVRADRTDQRYSVIHPTSSRAYPDTVALSANLLSNLVSRPMNPVRAILVDEAVDLHQRGFGPLAARMGALASVLARGFPKDFPSEAVVVESYYRTAGRHIWRAAINIAYDVAARGVPADGECRVLRVQSPPGPKPLDLPPGISQLLVLYRYGTAQENVGWAATPGKILEQVGALLPELHGVQMQTYLSSTIHRSPRGQRDERWWQAAVIGLPAVPPDLTLSVLDCSGPLPLSPPTRLP